MNSWLKRLSQFLVGGVVALSGLPLLAGGVSAAFKIDQLGYLPGEQKIAILSGPVKGLVKVCDDKGKPLLKVEPGSTQQDADSGDQVQWLDFSALQMPGTYYLEAPGLGRSPLFEVKENIFERAWYLVTRFFYGQRCGTAVDLGAEFPEYKHAACHLGAQFHASSGKSGIKRVGKGWHDAGDYGRYVVNSGISTGQILWAYEWFPERLKDFCLELPESGNGTPDILNEARWNLEWMLGMQDEDGGVWPKESTERFCGFVMPEEDTAPSFIIGSGEAPFKTTCATADFVAVMAIAGRLYQPFDAAFARQCLAAAEKAWAWALQHPQAYFKHNPPGIFTGGYGDGDSRDELLWASAELFRSTGKAEYNQYFLTHYTAYQPTLSVDAIQGWPDVHPMAMWAYYFSGQPQADPQARQRIEQDSLAMAHQAAQRSQGKGYRVCLNSNQYIWGSNGVVANYAFALLVAYRMKPEEAFLQAALDQVHYLLGRNTFGMSWITQLGAQPYQHPHHRPSAARPGQAPWPGMLAGGPNATGHFVDHKTPADTHPARCYIDDAGAFASNEVAINWNAPLVFVLAGLMDK